MSANGQGNKWNIAENLNRLSRAHQRYRRQTDRQTTDRWQTDGRQQIANVNVLKTTKNVKTKLGSVYLCCFKTANIKILSANSKRRSWLLHLWPVADWYRPKRDSERQCVEFADNILMFAVLKRRLLQLRNRNQFCFLVHGQVTIIFVVSVGLFVCAEFFSAVCDPILIKLGHMLCVWV